MVGSDMSVVSSRFAMFSELHYVDAVALQFATL